MTSVVLSVVGAVVGSYVGDAYDGAMIGAQIGAAIGGGVGAYIDRPNLSTYGPRMNDMKIMISAYGVRIPIVYGTIRVATNLIWSTDLVQHQHSTSVGKGGGQGETVSYTYTISCAAMICEGAIAGVTRIWMNSELVYSVLAADAVDLLSGGDSPLTATWRVYLGNYTQDRDPTIVNKDGVDATPAYRGVAYVVFDALDITHKFGNRLPSIEVEVARVVFTPPTNLTGITDTNVNDGSNNNTGGSATARSSVDYNRHRIYAGATGSANTKRLSYLNVADYTVHYLDFQIMTPAHPLIVMYSYILDKLIAVTCTTTTDPVTYYVIDPVTGIPTQNTAWPTATAGNPLRLYYEDLGRQKLRAAGFLASQFQTWNPSDKAGNVTLSNGNLTVAIVGGAANNAGVRGTQVLSSFVYFETTISAINGCAFVGLATSTLNLTDANGVGYDANAYGIFAQGGAGHAFVRHRSGDAVVANRINVDTGVSLLVNDVIGVQVVSGTIKFYKNPTGTAGSGTLLYSGTLPSNTWYSLAQAQSNTSCTLVAAFAFGYLAIIDTRGNALIANMAPLKFTNLVDVTDGDSGYIYVLMDSGALYRLVPPTTTGAQWTYSVFMTINTGVNGTPRAMIFCVTRDSLLVTCSDGTDGHTKLLEISITDGSVLNTIAVPALTGSAPDAVAKARCLVIDRAERLLYAGQFPFYVSNLALAVTGYNANWGDTSSSFGSVDYDGTLVTVSDGVRWDVYPSPLFLGNGLNAEASDIVLDIAARVGLAAGSLDVTALTSANIPGYVLGTQNTARSAIEPLMILLQSDAVESDGKIKFVLRNQQSMIDIPESDYVVTPGQPSDPIVIERLQDTDLPLVYNVTYMDTAVNYQQASQYGRRLTGKSKNVTNLQIPIAMTAAMAGKLADNLLYETWSSRLRFKLTLPKKYAAYEPTDVITLHKTEPTGAGTFAPGPSFQARIMTVSDDGSKLTLDCTQQNYLNGP